jgi:predicted Zn-dependent protease
MPGFFYSLGRMAGPKVRRAQWTWQSLVGSEEDIIAAEALVGQDLAAEVLRQVDLCKDADLAATVSNLGAGLARRLTNQKRGFHFYVVEAPVLNAFALPGGHVFVTRSILDLCKLQSDPMAFVLGHEMGHVVRGHAMDRMMAHSAVRLAGGLAAARTALGALARQAGVRAVQSVYSQIGRAHV